MLSNLMFRTKLILLLITVISGFAIVTFVAMQGSASQKAANNHLRTLSKIQNSNDALSINMLEIADQLRDLDDKRYPGYLATLNQQIDKNNKVIQTNIERSQSSELKTILKSTQTDINHYSNALLNLVKKRHIIGFDANSGLRGKIDQMGSKIAQDIHSLSLLRREFTNVRRAEASYLFGPSQEYLDQFNTSYDRLNTRFNNFGFEDTYGKEAQIYHDAVIQYGKEYVALDAADKAFSKQKAQFNKSQLATAKLIENIVLKAEENAKQHSQQANISLWVVSIVVTLIVALLIMSIGRDVHNTLKRIMSDLIKVKAGDMTAKSVVNERRNDEFDSLSLSLNEMTQGLDHVLKEVVNTTDTVNDMATDISGTIGEIANSNRAINNRTQSLASATDDISKRITQLSTTTDTLRAHSSETYESAKMGSQTIRMVLDNLKTTINVVNSTGDQLNELGRLSNNIDNVIGMINDLASQTNLLALNAAIEAARAGEAGRGFAVVSDEVRSLAEKTVDATAKITDIVNVIQTSTQGAISTMASGQDSLKVIEENGSKAETAIHTIESKALTSAQSADSMASDIQDVASTAVQMSAEMDTIAQQLSHDTGSIETLADKTQSIKTSAAELSQKTKVFTLS
ncbi:methyl-accepting chemotaxis protein [Marinomonas spartinae]|uniref:methyl-accepting chemotaxis protein n=1 Tax=Marinomonas spartinae TaxID=1792290 RepID=UPI0018F2233A|nr:methyl-accepting chemotaxis protein [Marinomonas spartinae]MBJ7556063.1 methyl-accepting chemotaxis protein [Marinomonas spartinae]